MRLDIRTLLIPLAFTLPCVAQVVSSAAPGSVVPVQVGSGRLSTTVTMYSGTPITGRPYSAESTSTTVRTLPGGTTLTQPGITQKLWRDTEGRTRTERQISMQLTSGAPPAPTVVEIRDPVAGLGYVLDESSQTAYRIKMIPFPTQPPPSTVRIQQVTPPIARAPIAPPQSITDLQGVQRKSESLGTQLMEGIEVTGTRQTTVYPVNFDGNDRPITVTAERWFSASLGIPVLTKQNDPRSGEHTSRYTNISVINPEISLFQPPADYQIVDIDGPAATIRMN